MNATYKSILLFMCLVIVGIIFGFLVFVPIFDDTFMGIFMGFLIGAGVWVSTRKKSK